MATQTPAQQAATKLAAEKAAAAKVVAAKLAADKATAAAAAARAAAISQITKEMPQLASPEKYVGSDNKANILLARETYIKDNLKLDPAPFKAGSYNIQTATNLAGQVNKFKDLGLTTAESIIDKKTLQFNTAEAEAKLIKDVYKLDPDAYFSTTTVPDLSKQRVFDRNTGKYTQPTMQVAKYDISKANQRFEYEKPKIQLSTPENFSQAVKNYQNALSTAQSVGITNLNSLDQDLLKKAGKLVRDFDSKNLSQTAKQIITSVTDATDAIDAINNQRKTVESQTLRSQNKNASGGSLGFSGKELESERGKLSVEQDALRRIESTAVQIAPKINETLSRFGLSDVFAGAEAIPTGKIKQVQTGLSDLSSGKVFGTGGLAGKLNINVTDDQILSDINTANKAKYKDLYDIGTAATIDLQSQFTQASQFLADLPAGDRRRVDTQNTIDNLKTELTNLQADTLKAKNFYENYQPVTSVQSPAAISQFRESLQLPEERTLQQIKQIDPNSYQMIQDVQRQYSELASQPIGATTNPETEALRRDVEQRIAGQVALGSQLGAEEQRQYQQAARGAQSARGNIFGIAPAVEEAVSTGLAGEQRLQARLGAAQGFLSSGQSMTDAAARDVGLRNALTQSRLGAAQGFIASGPTMYNMASQRLGQQEGMLNNYLAASQPQQTGGFQATPSASNPYAYVNPNAGFMGAQNAASIYNTLADYSARTYGANVGAIASQPSGAQQFGAIASGIGSLIPSFAFGK